MNTQYSTQAYRLGQKVPHWGVVSAIKSGEMEWEYLLIKAGVTTWCSHSDIEAMLKANSKLSQPRQRSST